MLAFLKSARLYWFCNVTKSLQWFFISQSNRYPLLVMHVMNSWHPTSTESKLIGLCRFMLLCHFHSINTEKTPSEEYVSLPEECQGLGSQFLIVETDPLLSEIFHWTSVNLWLAGDNLAWQEQTAQSTDLVTHEGCGIIITNKLQKF